MRLNEDYVVTSIADKYFLIPMGTEIIKAVKMQDLNDVSAFILNNMKEDINFEELADRVYAEYDADHELIEKDLKDFIAKGIEQGFIEE